MAVPLPGVGPGGVWPPLSPPTPSQAPKSTPQELPSDQVTLSTPPKASTDLKPPSDLKASPVASPPPTQGPSAGEVVAKKETAPSFWDQFKKPGDIQKDKDQTSGPGKINSPLLEPLLSKSLLGLGSAFFGMAIPAAKLPRFSGSFEDYRGILREHNQAAARRRAEEMIKMMPTIGGTGGILGGFAMSAFNPPSPVSLTPVPPLAPPPLISQSHALEVWEQRHVQSLGRLLTPPIGQVSPEVKRVQSKVQEMVEKLAGPELAAKGINLHVNLFSGDALNAFAARHSDEWESQTTANVSEKAAEANSTLATLRPILDPKSSGAPIYELGLTLGALKKLASEDELAFLLAHELAHVLEGHVEPVGGRWLSSQAHEAVADHEGFSMMVKAGYDPSQGLKLLNRLHEDHPAEDLNTLLEGLSAGSSSHHHEGVRISLGQMKLEQLRRTDSSAHPTHQPRPLPEWMKISVETPALAPVNEKMKATFSKLGLEYLEGELAVNSNSIFPKDSKTRDEIRNLDWNSKQAGQAFAGALESLAASPKSGQEKGDAALLLYLGLTQERAYPGGGIDLGEVAGEVAQFFQKQEQAGWKSQAFLEKLEQQSPDWSHRPGFAFNVLLAPGFQEASQQMANQSGEVRKLVEALPEHLASTHYKKRLSNEIDLKFLAAGLSVLAGIKPKDDSLGPQWSKDVIPGKGLRDDEYRQQLLAYVEKNCVSGAWDGHHLLQQLRDSQKKSQNPEFSQNLERALEALDARVGQAQDRNIALAFGNLESTRQLLGSVSARPLSAEQRDRLFEKFVGGLTNGYYPLEKDLPGYPIVGEMLADVLNSQKSTAQQKERAVQVGLACAGRGNSVSQWTGALRAHLRGKEPSLLSEQVVAEWSRPSYYGDQSPTPLSTTIGLDRELSRKIADRLPPGQLEQWIHSHPSAVKRPDTGSTLFLLDVLAAQSAQTKDLSQWSSQFYKLIEGRYPSPLEGRSEICARLASHVYPKLKELPLNELGQWLNQAPIQQILSVEQRADLIARLACAQLPEGGRVNGPALRGELERLEQTYQLANKPALRRALQEKVAERARLQPDQLREVFPQDSRTVSQQTQGLTKEVRGLSALVAATRTRSPQEQLQLVDFLMGRIPEAPAFFKEIDQQAEKVSSLTKISLSDLMEETRLSLKDADPHVRVAVATSFLAGPSGLLRQPEGREAVLRHFTDPVREAHRPLARSLASVLLDAHGEQDALAVGYLLAQKGEAGKALSEGEILNGLFDAYGVPGIKLKQYLAFTADFAEFREHFESSQDSAMPLNYLQSLRLIEHHYADKWPKHWEVRDVIGSGSVNVAVRFFDHQTQETRVVSLPREKVETCSEYDFWRMGQFLDRFTSDGDNQEKYGYLRGLSEVIRESVSQEFDRPAAFAMQQSVEPFYDRKVDGWTIKSVKAHSLDGKAIVMAEAKGRTARRVLKDRPDVYQSAMKAMALVEQDVLLGIGSEKNPTPQAMHANPDFHDGQVLIDEATQTVTILDFGQAVSITNEQRDEAIELLGIVGKGYTPEQAGKLLEKRAQRSLDQGEISKVLASPDSMDVFIKLLGTMASQGSKMSMPVVHWMLGIQRQKALGEKVKAPMDSKLRRLAAVPMTGGTLKAYNAIRIAQRSPMQALRGGILGPIGGWVEQLLTKQNLFHLASGRVRPLNL